MGRDRSEREAMHVVSDPPDEGALPRGGGSLREIVMGAQDNLTTVLAVVLGVAIGSGDVETVALAGLAAGTAEAISMGGVLYNSTRAERDLAEASGRPLTGALNEPIVAGAITFGAAIVAAAIPLAPFAVLPLHAAAAGSAVASIAALFALGFWTGGVTRKSRWRAGVRFVTIGGLAALGSALVGAALHSNGA
jgi:VIT1/CCC1 family predicted Fe2+/Mn2+ transporter